jgi:hypothetical protein
LVFFLYICAAIRIWRIACIGREGNRKGSGDAESVCKRPVADAVKWDATYDSQWAQSPLAA